MGQLVVLGPWEIEDANNYASRFGDADSKYAKFHNLNALAAELCKEDMQVVVDKKTLEECAVLNGYAEEIVNEGLEVRG